MKTSKIVAVLAALPLAVAFPAIAEDGYVVSDGTQYVNLGHCAGPNTKIELDFAFPEEVAVEVRPLASLGTASNLQPCVRWYIGEKRFGGELKRVHSFMVSTNNIGLVDENTSALGTNHTQAANLSVPVDLARHKISFDFAYPDCTVAATTPDGAGGDTTDDTHTFTGIMDKTSTIPLGLFAENRSATGIYSSELTENSYSLTNGFYAPAKMKVYGLKIWEPVGDVRTLLKEFTPVVKGGVAGLLETNYVTGASHFHSSERWDALAAGGDIVEIKDDPYIWSPKNVLGSGPENNIFIDTGYTVKDTTRVELDYAMMTNYADAWTAYPYLLGAVSKNQNDTALRMGFFAASPGSMAYRLGYGSDTAIPTFDIKTAHGIRRTVAMHGSGFSVVTAGWTNYSQTVSTPFTGTTFTQYNSLKLGANYAGNGRLLPMKIYGLRIYESDALVKDYVPFVTNGVGGLKNSLDATDTLFSKTMTSYKSGSDYVPSDGFATNVLFDVGGDIACVDGSDEAYLEFDGVTGHAIDTGCCVGTNSCIEIDYQIWNSKPNGWQYVLEQNDSGGSGILARLYYNSSADDNTMYFGYCDRSNGEKFKAIKWASENIQARVNNARTVVTLDSRGNNVKVVNGGATIWDYDMDFYYNYSRTATTCNKTLWVGGNCGGTGHGSCLRLYSLKISESGELAHWFVPSINGGAAGLYDRVTGAFLPLTGGKVSGRMPAADGLVTAPEPAASSLSRGETRTFSCFAPAALAYQWYKDGVAIDGETGGTLTVGWEQLSAPYLTTYSVKPVYTVFNEKVFGEAAEVAVTSIPGGLMLIMK